MAQKSFLLSSISPNPASSYKIYGDSDSYTTAIITVAPGSVIIIGTDILLLGIEIGTETKFKVSSLTGGFESALSNEIDTSINRGLFFDYNDIDRLYFKSVFDYTQSYFIECRMKITDTEHADGGGYMGCHSSSSMNCYFGIVGGEAYGVFGSTGGSFNTPIDLGTFYTFKIEFLPPSTVNFYLDDLVTPKRVLGWTPTANDIIHFATGKMSNPTLGRHISCEVDYINYNGVIIDNQNIQFDRVLDSLGNFHTIETKKSDAELMRTII